MKTKGETRPTGVWGYLAACRENATSAPRVFPKPITEKKKKNYYFAVLTYIYVEVLQKVKIKRRNLHWNRYNNKSSDNN